MAEGQRADHQPGHDLVADAQAEGPVEGVVGQGHRRRHGDDITGEQRQLHPRPALGDPIAHGGDPAGELGGGADLLGGGLDDVREGAQRLMRRQHVVVGRDDADVDGRGIAQLQLVVPGQGGEGVGPVGAGQLGPAGAGPARGLHALQIVRAAGAAALDDAVGDLLDLRMHGFGS